MVSSDFALEFLAQMNVYFRNFPNAENPYGPLSPNEAGVALTLLNVKKR